MKRFIIGGVPRSGKSSLCRRLSSTLRLSHYPVDSFVSTFGKAFPELGISHYERSHLAICKRLWPFLQEFLQQLDYESLSYVVDAYHIRPVDIREHIRQVECQVIFLGYPSVTPLEKVTNIRKFARKSDWTETLSEQALMDLVKRFIEESQQLQQACRAYDMDFVDTSQDFSKILDQIFVELTNEVNS